MARLLGILGDIPTLVATPGRLCRMCAEVLDVDGAGISLIVGGQLQGLLCATDDKVGRLERLQFGLGEGPCGTAFAAAAPVLEARLEDAAARWPVFVQEALRLGVGGVFSFPLGPGLASIGALTTYRNDVRDLTADQLGDALVLADVITEIIMAIQLGTPPDELGGVLESVGGARREVHQATGMVAAQLGVPVAEALSRLRAHAWSNHLGLGDIAADVVARRLRFAAEPPL